MNEWIIIARIILAAVIGGALGYEREKIGKEAGVRTYALVCLGSTLFTLLAVYGFGEAINLVLTGGIVTGIGFIGAGLIIQHGEHIRGLTTAAGLWATAALGIGIGVGWYGVSVFTGLIIFLILFSSRKIKIETKYENEIK